MEKSLWGGALGFSMGMFLQLTHPVDAILNAIPGMEPGPLEYSQNLGFLGLLPFGGFAMASIVPFLPILWGVRFLYFGPDYGGVM